MNDRENQELNLDDILREFGVEAEEKPEQKVAQEAETVPPAENQPEEELEDLDEESVNVWLGSGKQAAPATDLEQTQRIDPVQIHTKQIDVTGDTIRLDGLTDDTIRLDDLTGEIPSKPQKGPLMADTQRIWQKDDTVHSDMFSGNWEPEYEQPMGEYVPPQPIQFNPRSRFRELKKKLVEGPEKRFYELSENGVGRLQAAIFFSLLVVLVCVVSTAMYAMGMVQENRMRLMVFAQFIAMLISAFLGSNQLVDGIADLANKKFTLNSLLAITFLVCCVDGGLCLHQVRVPCCAAFSLEMTMSLWSEYHRKSIEMSQMDTMRKATRLDGVAVCTDYMDGKKGLLRVEGEVEAFMDRYEDTCRPEKTLQVYSLIATVIAFGIGIFAGVKGGFSTGVQVTSVSLLAAVPATAFVAHSRPTILLERRLHQLGTVLCGWQGVEGLCGKTIFPLTYGDLYPSDAMRLNGVKYFGAWEPELVAAYATAVMEASDCGLWGLFNQVLDSHNGRHYDATNIVHYDNGGVCGVVEGELVLIGSASFLKDMDVEVPENARVSYGVYVAIGGELSGLFAVSYEKTRSATAGLTTLTAYRGLQCALVSDDFMLTSGFLRSKFGVKSKRFLLPDYETRAQLRQKELEPDAKVLLMTTALGLAPLAYGVTGARALRTTCRMGTVLHIVGGVIGLGIMILLTVLGALEVLTPANMFLYELAWMIPALLFTEWTRSI